LLLFEDLVLAAWRLRRARMYETAVASRLFRSARRDQAQAGKDPDVMKCLGAMLQDDAEGKKVLDYVSRMEDRHRRTYYKAVKELRLLQQARTAPSPPGQPIEPEAHPPELALVAQVAATPEQPAAPAAGPTRARMSRLLLRVAGAILPPRPALCGIV
jgi:hypothetical protein